MRAISLAQAVIRERSSHPEAGSDPFFNQRTAGNLLFGVTTISDSAGGKPLRVVRPEPVEGQHGTSPAQSNPEARLSNYQHGKAAFFRGCPAPFYYPPLNDFDAGWYDMRDAVREVAMG